ncbi:MAG: hypothetical protein WC619_02385 [Patescibacteria group bacterium]
MRFYIMTQLGFWEEIPVSEIKFHATVFMVEDRRILEAIVEFSPGKYAKDTKLSRIGERLDSFAGKLSIKVCGPAVFLGRPVEVKRIGGNAWSQKGDWYLETEIVAGKLYCYSWIANSSDEDPLCVSFEFPEEDKEKK